VIVTEAVVLTATVSIVKPADVAPCDIATESGVVTLADEPASVTTAPPLGAGPFIVAVQKVDAPDATLTRLHTKDVSVGSGGDSVIITLRDAPFSVAVTVRVTLLVTALAITVKLPVVDPAGTAADPGVVRYDPLSVSPTVTPPDGVARLNVTVHVEFAAPLSVVGLHTKDVSVGSGGDSVIVTLRDAPLNVAITVLVRALGTSIAVTIKFAVLDPAVTTTDPGVVRYDPLSVSSTVTPPEGAVVLSVTVQVSEPAPVIDAVPHVREDSPGRMEIPGRIRAVPVTVAVFPAAEAPKVLLNLSAAPVDPDVSVADILATTPAGIAAAFIPATIHVYVPARATHERSLPAVFNDDPATALIDAIAEAGYCSVHCNALAPEPCGDHLTSKLMAPFDAGTPGEMVNAPPPCAKTIMGRSSRPRTSFIEPRIKNENGPG
jgi:hypothetical protein